MAARVLEMVSLLLRKSLEEGLDSEGRRDIVDLLLEEGNNPNDVHAALDIFEHIQQRLESPSTSFQIPPTNRLFMIIEEMHLSPEIRGYLNQLVDFGVLDPVQREELVERLLMIDPDELTVDDVESLLEEILNDGPRRLGHFDETISDYYH